MKPLRVLVSVKPKPSHKRRDNRAIGLFSYAVPEFTWDFKSLPGDVSTERFAGRYDLFVIHDGAPTDHVTGPLPVVGIFWDTTGSEGHYTRRFEQAKSCDLVLVDHDDVRRFYNTRSNVRRLSYCVNDKIFKDYGLRRTADIANHQGKSLQGHPHWARRNEWFNPLRAIVAERGYTYREGLVNNITDYAQSFNSARVAVNFARTARNRPHRVYDVMAARGCLVTTALPRWCGDDFIDGVHYLGFDNLEGLRIALTLALDGGEWSGISDAAYHHVHTYHTWRVRARELRTILQRELGL